LRADYVLALKIPTIALVISYVLIIVTIRQFPNFVPLTGVAAGTGFLVILGWSIGAWAGYKIVESGGNYIDAMLVSVIMAAVNAFLQIVVVGILVNFPAPADFAGEVPVAVFSLLNVVAGALTAGGFALTK
jgi:hypothetical protein